MSLARKKRQLQKKAEKKAQEKVVGEMNPLQRFAFDALNKGLITNAHLEEMAEFFCKQKHLTRDNAIKYLESLGYKVTREEP